jgi:hypothetical protein
VREAAAVPYDFFKWGASPSFSNGGKTEKNAPDFPNVRCAHRLWVANPGECPRRAFHSDEDTGAIA